jgi:hypothetical protein
MMLVLSVAPAALVAYMMICRLNERKRSIWDFEGWAFLFILGGSIWTFYKACSVGMSPMMGKQFLDIGILLYFGQRTWRGRKWKFWHSKQNAV